MSRTIRIPPEPSRHIITAIGIVRDTVGRILLSSAPEPGWELPGGVIEPGEDIAGGLLRHISEKTGVQVQIVRPLGIYSICDSPYYLTLAFACACVADELLPDKPAAWFEGDKAAAVCALPFENAPIADFFTPSPNIIYRAYQNGAEVRLHDSVTTTGPGNDEQLPEQTADTNHRHIIAVSAFVRYGIGPILMIHYRSWALPEAVVQQGEDLITALQDYVEVNAGYKIVPEQLAAIYCNIGEPYAIRFMFRCRLADNVLPNLIGTRTVEWQRPNDATPEIGSKYFPDRGKVLLDQIEDGLNAKKDLVYYVYRTRPNYESIAEMRFPPTPQKAES